MKNLGYELKTARYSNSTYDAVKAFWFDPNNREAEDGSELLLETAIRVDDSNSQWTELLELITLEDIMENTYLNNQHQTREFELTVMKIAKQEGMVYDIDQGIDSNIYKAIVKALFSEFDPKAQKEQLFMLKMELFNVDFIKKVKDRALKKELRQAPDLMSTIEAACKIYREVNKS
jgi:hypothetical protein